MFAPMSQGELLDGAFHLYGKNFRTIIGVAAVCNGPGQVLMLYAQVSGGLLIHPGEFLIAFLVAAVGGFIGSAAILKVISDGYLGREPSSQDAIRFALSRVLALFVAGLARTILVMLASLLLFVPGIIVACGYSVVSQVVVLENLPRATDALGRSWQLTKGHKMTALVVGVVLYLVAIMPGGVVAGVLGVLGYVVVGQVLAALSAIVLAPLLPCGMTLYYYDLRVRKEAFDLQVLSQLLGPPA